MRPTLRIRAGRLRLRLRQVVATLAVVGLGSLGLGAVAAMPASAAPVCQVAYTVANDWGTGFTTGITITNNGPAISSWTLGYSYSGNQTLSSGWSGNWSQSGKNVTVTNVSWNGSLATGASANFGANFNYTGTNTAPTTFTLNGNTCNGSSGGQRKRRDDQQGRVLQRHHPAEHRDREPVHLQLDQRPGRHLLADRRGL
jgi:Cellulose binding domain